MESTEGKIATVYILRHGETIGNIQKIILHPDEDVLSDIGKTQAGYAAKNLKDIHFTQVYTSQYPRTKDTAKIILENNLQNKSPNVKVDERLQEIGIDNSYGKPYQNLLRSLIEFLNTGKPTEEFSFEDSEPVPEVRQRAKSFIQDMIQSIRGSVVPQTILVVSHGLLIRLLMESFHDPTVFVAEGWDPFAIKITRNTGCMQLTISVTDDDTKPKITFQKIHDFSHFPKEMLETDSLTRLVQTPEGKCLSGCFQV